jgi:hypothetical protein
MSIPNFQELTAQDLSFANQLEAQVLEEIASEEAAQIQNLALARCVWLTRQTHWMDFIQPGGQIECRDVLGNVHTGIGAVSDQWLTLASPHSYRAVNVAHLVSVSGLATKTQPVSTEPNTISIGDELRVWLTDKTVLEGIVASLGEDFLRLRAPVDLVLPILNIVALQKVSSHD